MQPYQPGAGGGAQNGYAAAGAPSMNAPQIYGANSYGNAQPSYGAASAYNQYSQPTGAMPASGAGYGAAPQPQYGANTAQPGYAANGAYGAAGYPAQGQQVAQPYEQDMYAMMDGGQNQQQQQPLQQQGGYGYPPAATAQSAAPNTGYVFPNAADQLASGMNKMGLGQPQQQQPMPSLPQGNQWNQAPQASPVNAGMCG